MSFLVTFCFKCAQCTVTNVLPCYFFFQAAVKHMVLFQREHLQRTQPKPSYTKVKTTDVSSVKEKTAVNATPGNSSWI